MPKILKLTLIGNPILRQKARRLIKSDIRSQEIQNLISDMKYTIASKRYGVGLAAPQVNRSLAISVVAIKLTPSRPKFKPYEKVIINPEIIETFGHRTQLWEGCASFHGGNQNFPYVRCLRWRKIKVRYLDEKGKKHEKELDGILAHVFQHEIDHLNGVLFVDKVRDAKTWMMVSEYKKQFVRPKHKIR